MAHYHSYKIPNPSLPLIKHPHWLGRAGDLSNGKWEKKEWEKVWGAARKTPNLLPLETYREHMEILIFWGKKEA